MAVCRRVGNRKPTMLGSDLYPDTVTGTLVPSLGMTRTLVPSLQICTLTGTLVPSLEICTLTGTPVPSLLWHFLFQFFFISFCSQWKESENNFNMASRKTEYACILQQNTSLPFICLKNSVLRLHKAQYRSRYYVSERFRDLHMCHPNPEKGHILDWKTNELQNMSKNIYNDIFIIFILYAKNLSIQNMPQLYR